MTDQSTGLAGIAKFVCAILGFVLFRWTPQTGRDFLIYGALFLLFVLLCVFIFSRSHKDVEDTGPALLSLDFCLLSGEDVSRQVQFGLRLAF